MLTKMTVEAALNVKLYYLCFLSLLCLISSKPIRFYTEKLSHLAFQEYYIFIKF
jgi:hypothetical protein